MVIEINTRASGATRTVEVTELAERLDDVLTDVRDFLRTVHVVSGDRLIARISPPIEVELGRPPRLATPEERERLSQIDAETRASLQELPPEPFDAVEELRGQPVSP